MEKAELVFVPSPGIGHLASMVELAKVLVDRDNRVSITVIIIRLALDSKISKDTESLTATSMSTHIQFIDLPSDKTNASNDHPSKFVTSLIESQKPHVKEFVSKLITQSELNLIKAVHTNRKSAQQDEDQHKHYANNVNISQQ